MKLSEIKFVIDLEHPNPVNKYLENGWVLLDTYTKSYDPEIAPNDLNLHYVLGATDAVDYSKEKEDLHCYDDLKFDDLEF